MRVMNIMKRKAQAMVEYVLLIALTAVAFTSMNDFFDKAIASFFKMIGTFFSQKGP